MALPDDRRRPEGRRQQTYFCAEKYLNPDDYATGADAGDDQSMYTGCQDDIVRWVGPAGYFVCPDAGQDVTNINIFGSAHSVGFTPPYATAPST